ncbi:MAG: aldehyde dehydrogenase family protein [Parvularculaceae bacterium]|nr:aldehyde dehydrogenase family protein [Parvularculaceae bacterium]
MASLPPRLSDETRAFVANAKNNLIAGEWRKPGGSSSIDCIDPSTGETVAAFAPASTNDVDAAIDAARRSFDTGAWRSLTPAERAKRIWRIGELIDAHRQELSELESLDGGKPFAAAFNGEAPAAAEAFRYHAGWCTKIDGGTFKPSIGGLDLEGVTRLEPVGVAGLITPWNGPLVMAAWKLAPALAAGCSVVLKPSELTILSTLRLGELICEAGIPDGVVNIVVGSGAVVGDAITRDPRVDKISFTGSTASARAIIDAGKGNLKRLSLELGGKSPVVIFDDAKIDEAIAGAAGGIFGNAGQVCVAGSRILVQRTAYQRVADGLRKHAEALKLGGAFDETTMMGPLISAAHRSSVDRTVKAAIDEGAERLAGGRIVDGPGFFYQPTVLADAGAKSCAWREEIFGPVATLAPFDDEEEALRLANDTQYGLAASVWTENASRAQRMSRALRAGIVWVNCHGIPDMAMPIGGYKQSGWGREHGRLGLEAFLEHKSVMQRVFS